MTERNRRVENVLERMGRMVVPVADDPDAARARVIAALDGKLDFTRKTRKSLRRTRWLLAMAACLSVGAAVSLNHLWHAPRASASVATEPSDLVRRGDAIATTSSERHGHLENGAALTVARATELTVSAVAVGGDELILDRGRIELAVPKLLAGRTLSVTTPDATVTVRGTRFAVEVQLENAHPTTRVDVTEGSVWVRSGSERLVLSAGSHWTSLTPSPPSVPSGVEPVVPSEPAAAPASAPEASAPAPLAHLPPAAPSREKSPTAPESSTLAEENALYARAVSALHAGQTGTGISSLEQLLARYPSSPLAQNAAVERFRALRRSGRNAEALAQARQYLASYPAGFARDEAKAIVEDFLPKGQ